MPYFDKENSPDKDPKVIVMLNTRYDMGIADITLITPDQYKDEKAELIEQITYELPSDEEDIALLLYLHGDGETDLWVDDYNFERSYSHKGGNVYRVCNRREYLVVSSSDLDDVYRDYMVELIDDCVIPNLPENLKNYFDYDSYIDDSLSGDGYGQLAPYDGNDNEVQYNGTYYHIFRLN